MQLRTLHEKRPKQKPLSWYKKKLWDVFAAWVKKNEKNICFTCDRYCVGRDCHAGHFIKASVCGIELYFSEINVHIQCSYCNIRLDGNQYEYGTRLGKVVVGGLKEIRAKTKGKVWSREEYQKKIEYYQSKLTR